jgi:hypothetical protein
MTTNRTIITLAAVATLAAALAPINTASARGFGGGFRAPAAHAPAPHAPASHPAVVSHAPTSRTVWHNPVRPSWHAPVVAWHRPTWRGTARRGTGRSRSRW